MRTLNSKNLDLQRMSAPKKKHPPHFLPDVTSSVLAIVVDVLEVRRVDKT